MTQDEIRLKRRQYEKDMADARINLDLLRLKCPHPKWVGFFFKRCRDCGLWR